MSLRACIACFQNFAVELNLQRGVNYEQNERQRGGVVKVVAY